MTNRLKNIEVISMDKSWNSHECQLFIEQWNQDNPDKFNDETFMPLFSPFITGCELLLNDDNDNPDLLKVIMEVTPDNWPSKQEVAQITFFVTSLKDNYDNLDVKMLFDVIWEEKDEIKKS